MNGNTNVDFVQRTIVRHGAIEPAGRGSGPDGAGYLGDDGGNFSAAAATIPGFGNSSDSGGVEEAPAGELAKAVAKAIGHLHSRTRNKHLIERKQSFLDSF
jgi:hypothetical protein